MNRGGPVPSLVLLFGAFFVTQLLPTALSTFTPPVYQKTTLPSPSLEGAYQGCYDSTNKQFLVVEYLPIRFSAIKEDGSKVYIAGNGIKTGYNTATAGVTGPATSAMFKTAHGIWGDTMSNIFVADRFGMRIRKVTPDGQIANFAGNGVAGQSGDGGPATSARFEEVIYLFGDSEGNLVFTDYANRGATGRIRKVSKNNIISTLVGGGSVTSDGATATSAQISGASGVFVTSNGDVFWTSWNENNLKILAKSTQQVRIVAGSGGTASPTSLSSPFGVWGDDKDNLFVAEQWGNRVTLLPKSSNYQTAYVASGINSAVSVYVDNNTGKVYVVDTVSVKVLTDPLFVSSALSSAVPTTSPSTQPSSAAPSVAASLIPPEYSLMVSAKSFKYFEIRVFTEANERVFPVSYELVDCPENAGAVIWGHESTPITEDTNTCVYGLPRHYWCECPTLVNGNKPKLTLNFGGTVFDRVELLILDWVDGEVTVSDSANNIVLFSASRAGGPLAGEEFVGYNHLNLLQVAPSVMPTITPSSVPTTKPSWTPTTKPTIPSIVPTQTPTVVPTTTAPSAEPSVVPSAVPSAAPSFTAQYTITLTAKTFKYFEVRVYTHDNLRIFPVSYELEHCPENAGSVVWNDQTTEDTNTCVYGYPRNFWCACAAVADAKPKLVLHMGHTVFDRVELLLLNWEDGEVTVTDEANHETFLSATHDGVGNEFVTFGNLNLEHAVTAPVRRLLRGG